jgi:hypothetical protein
MLTPFSIKDGMSLAKPLKDPLQDTSEFDQLVSTQSQSFTSDYLKACRTMTLSRQIKPVAEEEDVIIVSDPPKQRLPRFKLLQFKENHRPAYYGSWRRARGTVTPRNPLKKDEVLELEARYCAFHISCPVVAGGLVVTYYLVFDACCAVDTLIRPTRIFHGRPPSSACHMRPTH